ncbi:MULTISPECIES: glycosyltransferase [unclassified Mesorhizobium]|uniref:glycosyltransferase family 8 protein n=1 Tax=unclassified Mesorhizobium TaxID=325217 RepID=UPI00333DFDE7
MSDLIVTLPFAQQNQREKTPGKAAVVLVTDQNYFLPTFATALSADAHTGGDISIYLFVVNAKQAWLQQFGAAVSGTKISIKAASFPQLAELSRFHRDVVPPIALARLWIGSLLEEDIGRLLYIDGDTMVDDELDSLLAISPPEHGLMAVPDFMRIYIDEMSLSKGKDIAHLRDLGCSPTAYFNSGVIYASKNAWNSIASSAIKFLREHPDRCIASDQSALNHAAQGNVYFLPLRYNYQSEYMMALDPRELGFKPTIWHFVGAPKPWDAPGWPWDEYFNKFYRQAESVLRNCSVTLPVPPKAQIVAGLSHRERNRFRMKWVYPWRRYTRRRKILSLLSQ